MRVSRAGAGNSAAAVRGRRLPRARGLLGACLREIANDLDLHLLACLQEWLASEWRFDRALFVIAERETRQATLLAGAGLQFALDVCAGRRTPVARRSSERAIEYRIVYEVDDASRIVRIVKVSNRRDVYRV
jgi:hypothetical protein